MATSPTKSYATGRAQYNAYRQAQVDKGKTVKQYSQWAKTKKTGQGRKR